MQDKLKTGRKVVGLKQSRRAVETRAASALYLAEDADPPVPYPVRSLCREAGVPVIPVPTMAELGRACGISVGAAVAAVLD
jgi:large subunit ribosomal protein L7A